MDEADIIKKRQLSIIEDEDLAARASLRPIPERLGPNATGEQIQQRRELMTERARQLAKISKKSAAAKRELEDHGHESHLKRVEAAYEANAKRKAGKDAYEASAKGKAAKIAYEASAKGKAAKAVNEASAKRKAIYL